MSAAEHGLAELLEVSKSFGLAHRQVTALDRVSLRAHPGEVILLLGPSGSGKTTLLTILAGLQPPTSGTVRLFGQHLTDYGPRALQRLRATGIGFVFQAFHLIDSLTVLENVMLVARFAGASRSAARERALPILERLDADHLARSRPRELSQGEKQRVAVARALVNGARLLLADEPTGSLASPQAFEVAGLIREAVRDQDRCALVVSHDERMAGFADRVLDLRDGRLSERRPLRA